jgi:hypothetical protein
MDVEDAYAANMATLNGYLDLLMDHSGVTCFSARRNAQRMWASYGDNHGGACIEFTTSPEASRFSNHLARVQYTSSRIPICPSTLVDETTNGFNAHVGAFLFCIKHTDWQDEEEWRLLMLATSEQTQKQRIVPFERTAITRVFLGPRIGADAEQAVRQAAGTLNPPVPVFKRTVDDREAQEQNVGVELVTSLDQLLYWGGIRPRS